MKNSKVAILLMVLLLLLTSCSQSQKNIIASGSQINDHIPDSSKITSSQVEIEVVDKTTKSERFQVDGLKVIGNINGSPDMERVYYTVQDLYDNSNDILYGTIDNLGYWDESGTGHTLYDFVV